MTIKKNPRKKRNGRRPPPGPAAKAIPLSKLDLVTQPINVKLTTTEREALDDLVKRGAFESRSAAVRAGLGAIFDRFNVGKDVDEQIERERRYHRPRCKPGGRNFEH